MRRRFHLFLILIVIVCKAPPAFAAQADRYFQITVVDEATGRGVPLVELRTTNEVRWLTDSSGIVALDEPGLMGRDVFFHVSSHGYEYPKDGFGYRGTRVKVEPGGSVTLQVKRLNIAERLYRVTGEGIYRDTLLVGKQPPIEEPLLNALIVGQDSVLATTYRDRIFWIWGDTNRLSYPLGNFGAAGATSELPPPRGRGLNPNGGVNLKYFVDDKGFSRPMVPAESVPGPGPKWLGGLVTVRDRSGSERMIAQYSRMKNLSETLERGLVMFDDETETFRRLVQFDLAAPLYLQGHPSRVRVPASSIDEDRPDAIEYFYCGYSVPHGMRVRADLDAVQDPRRYEGFTCLVEGTRFAQQETQIDRDDRGRPRYSWKCDTPPLSFEQQRELIAAGLLHEGDGWLQLRDIETGKLIKPHTGSVHWNEFRRRWIMIVEQSGGTSFLGEVWFAEADTPIGPWVYARKIVTHDKYSFYNPTQHPFFDQDGGRVIYFEGTYSDLFSGGEKTPRYDYNQIMYRLALDDERLRLPVPVYRFANESRLTFGTRTEVVRQNSWNRIEQIPFFAMTQEVKPGPDWVAVQAIEQAAGTRLVIGSDDRGARLCFYAVKGPDSKSDPAAAASPSEQTVPLYEFQSPRGGWHYSTDPAPPDDSFVRSAQPICYVWPNPMTSVLLDPVDPVHDRGATDRTP